MTPNDPCLLTLGPRVVPQGTRLGLWCILGNRMWQEWFCARAKPQPFAFLGALSYLMRNSATWLERPHREGEALILYGQVQFSQQLSWAQPCSCPCQERRRLGKDILCVPAPATIWLQPHEQLQTGPVEEPPSWAPPMHRIVRNNILWF